MSVGRDAQFEGGQLETAVMLSRPSPRARRNSAILVVGFALLILLGTLLLRLPLAGGQRPLSWEEAFFISTSATTVTGLSTIAPARDLSLFGQLVVLVLIEVGGVGFITFATVLFALIGRRLGIAERILLRQSLGVLHTGAIARVGLYVLLGTLAIQLAGALLLWLRWRSSMDGWLAAYLALFHSVSAFCNAGFDLWSGGGPVLFGFGTDPFSLGVIMVLIFLGSLGVVIVLDLITYPWDRRLMVYTKLTLLLNGVLIVGGLAIVLGDELFGGTALATLSSGEKLWVSLFSVVGARTAGMTIVPMDQLSQASTLVIMVSMFIGGAPASMGGGVTTSTVVVLLVAVFSTIRGLPQATAFGRTIPLETIAKAVAIMTVSTLLCFFVTLCLLATRNSLLLPVAFEVVSAFSNTGYSLGATTEVGPIGRLLLSFTMFYGRLGPLTLVIMLAHDEKPTHARYPAEQIVIG